MGSSDDRSAGELSEPREFGSEFFEGMVAAATDAVVTADAEGTVVYANDAVEDLLGYAPADLRGREFTEFVPDRFRDRYESWLRRFAEGDRGTPIGDETFEVTGVTADGEEQRLSISSFVHEADGRTLFSGILRAVPSDDESAERLREEEALVEELFDTSPVAISIRDADGELVRANERAAELVGIDPDDVSKVAAGETVGEYSFYGTDGQPCEHPAETVVRTGEPTYNEELVVEPPDGDPVYLSVNAAPIYDDGEIDRVVCAAEDVSELKQTQFELERRREELETELSAVFARVTDAFFALDDDWNFTYVNDEAEELLARPAEDLVGENVWEAFSAAEGTRFQREYETAMAAQEPVSFEEHYPPLSTWFEVRAYPSETGLSVYFRDVTERKARERELRDRVKQQRAVAEFSQAALADRSLDDLFDEAAELVAETLDHDYCKVLERHPEDDELLLRNGVGWDEGVVGSATVADDRGSQAGYTLISAEPVVVEDLEREDRFSGPELLTRHDVQGGISTVIGSPDDPWGILGTHDTERQSYADHDVQFVQSIAHILTTAIHRREREQQLERYETIVETVEDGVYALDADERFVLVNDAFCELTGYDREELLGRHASVVHSDEINDRAAEMSEAVADELGSATLEFELRTKDGDTVPVETRFGPYRYEDDEFARTGVVRDVTERKARERELEQVEAMVEAVEDGIYALDEGSRFIAVNDAFVELLGYEREELLGEHASLVTDPENVAYGEELVEEFAAGDRDVATVEEEMVTKNGRRIPVENRVTDFRIDEDRRGRVGVFRDISERLERQRELEAQNERLDAFASMLAHELRNPLEIAQIYLDMGVERAGTADGEAGDEPAFEEVERALDRIEEMIETLLVVTRRGGVVDTTEAVDLGEKAREWWANLDPEGTLDVTTDRTIRADRSRLRQLLENLYRNASEHAGPGVSVRVGDLEGGFYVEDDGPGIPEDERGQVFDPGYSTSNVGIGFGLAVVRQLVEAHDWHCEITESEAGGARFEFTGVEFVER